MALDHSRLGMENKVLETKSGWIFASTSLLCKILPTNLGACKATFYTFYTSHLRWKSTMRRCFYHTDLRQLAVSFTIFQDKLHSFNIQDHRSSRGLLAKLFKKFQKSPIRPAGSNFWLSLKELRFNIIKNLLCLLFIDSFMRICNFKKRFIRAAVLLQAMFMNDRKQTVKRWKLQETTNNKHLTHCLICMFAVCTMLLGASKKRF